ncbi:MAG: hypothetical protein MRZ91_05115 [Christensenellaceae bacterium]|nr:hypothetical protein [Christensenellaceae bacterium]MDD6927248.1 hypothetical protein [bacterium]MDY2851481.1 hypothetical protein [Christensenellaceae bacterium]
MNLFNTLAETSSFYWVGDVALVLIFLIFMAVGIKKGFLGLLVGFLGLFMIFIISFLLYKPVSSLLAASPLNDTLTSTYADVVSNTVAGMSDSVKIFVDVPLNELTDEQISAVLAELKLPSFILSSISNLINNAISSGSAAENGMTIKTVVASGMVNITISAIAWILMFIISSIVMFILRRFVNVFNKIPVIGGINMLLGAVLNLIIGFGIVCIITGLFILISPSMPASVIDYVNNTVILSWFYNNNPIGYVFTWFTNTLAA